MRPLSIKLIMMDIKSTYFIFDLDGTLADTLQDIVYSVNIMLESMHMPERSTEEIKQCIGSGIHKVIETLTGSHDTSFIERGVSCFRESYADHLLDHTSLYKGVEELVSHSDFRGSGT